MSSEYQDFQFELSETLYFNPGEEVLELIGISMNPDIAIHSYDTYVSIRGEIELRGEYIRDEVTVEVEERPLTFDDLEAKRYVDQVEEKEGRLAEFVHRFPVDISVPAYRVDNTEDIQISITNFDYEFPMNSKLQFTAIAEIQGIKAEFGLREVQESVELKEEPIEDFAFEVTREENQFEDEEETTAEDTTPQIIEEEIQEEVLRETLEEVEDETEEDEIEAEESRVERTEAEESNVEEFEIENSETEIEESAGNELNIRAMEEPEEENGESEGSKKQEVKDVSYLTDIFRDEGEEQYTKMKICIVQEDDTIESIAERFQVSTLQLIKQNKLDDDFDIHEGELLYIPKK